MTALALQIMPHWSNSHSVMASPNGLAEDSLRPRIHSQSASSALVDLPFRSWSDTTVRQLAQLMTLPEDWDMHGGQPIRRDAIVFALLLLDAIMAPNSPTPDISPLSYGGVQLEWHQKDIDLEIVVHAPNEVDISYVDARLRKEEEFEISTDFSSLLDPIWQLTTR